MLDPLNSNLMEMLKSRDVITFRYIVDSFGLGIQANSKSVLFQLANDRQNAFVIANAPSVKTFKDSITPSFKDLTGSVSAKMITEGGDLSKNPKVLYSLPNINQGSNYGAFYYPFLQVRDRGKNVTVPPAGYVSNNFIEKYVSAVPWAIVAGARRGVLSGSGLVGIESNLSKDDRDYLEPFGINPIIFQNGVGIVVFGNKTAQQNIKSSLSSIHVREVLIYLEDGIAAILKNFIFEFNTAQTRLEIKTLADNFLRQIKANNGIYDFRNIIDETNNTPEVIDRNIGILDTYVEIEPVLRMVVLCTIISNPLTGST
jgi:phage tail sheath protein FI